MTTVTAAALVLTLAGCSKGAAPPDEGPLVVVTTNVLGDLVNQIAGGAASVEVLFPLGADPHDFTPSARQVALIATADLVVANGLGLEERMADVIGSSSGDTGTLFEVGPAVDPQPLTTGQGLDPHVWLDPYRMADAARQIGDRLVAIDADTDWRTRSDRVADELIATDQEITGILASIPADRRILITNHDSLGYFARRYGFEIAGIVIPGGSTQGSPSSADLARLADLIRSAGVPAIFAETSEPSVLAETVAGEVGRRVEVVELYTGSLGPAGSGADTLQGMLVTNAKLISDALSGV